MSKTAKKSILVTGGAGFIGSHLTDALIQKGCRVAIIDNLSTGKKENINPRAEFYKLDIRNFAAIKPVFKKIDYVFHLAALARIQPAIIDPIGANEVNIDGTLNVLVAARDSKVKKVIYSASSSSYGDQKKLPLAEEMIARPKSPYSVQKYVGELYSKLFFELYGLPTVSLRYFNVYGPRESGRGPYATVIGIFLRQKASGQPLTIVGDGSQRRDFTYVADVVRANILAMEKPVGRGEVINIGVGKNYNVKELAKLIGGPTVHIPPRPGEMKATLADIRRAKKLLGWRTKFSLKEGIKKYIEHKR